MDARQGNPVRTPARATLAGAMDGSLTLQLHLLPSDIQEQQL